MTALPRQASDLHGQKFGRLTVVSFVEVRRRAAFWLCQCECGKQKEIVATHLRMGHTTSCGCYRMEALKASVITHGRTMGGAIPPEYRSWQNMKDRCGNPNNSQYRYYGGRGIRVCDQWKDFAVFLTDVGTRPSPQHSLDRYPDVNGNYQPGNVRWATTTEQSWNRRNVIWVEMNGVRQPLKAWAKELALPYKTIHRRWKLGLPMEKVFSHLRTKQCKQQS